MVRSPSNRTLNWLALNSNEIHRNHHNHHHHHHDQSQSIKKCSTTTGSLIRYTTFCVFIPLTAIATVIFCKRGGSQNATSSSALATEV